MDEETKMFIDALSTGDGADKYSPLIDFIKRQARERDLYKKAANGFANSLSKKDLKIQELTKALETIASGELPLTKETMYNGLEGVRVMQPIEYARKMVNWEKP